MIIITKPGTTLERLEGHSNMQLYELEVTKKILSVKHDDVRLMTIPDIVKLSPEKATIFVYVSIPKYNEEFEELLNMATSNHCHLILVSNDPRLKFEVTYGITIPKGSKITMLTNATRNIDEYMKNTFRNVNREAFNCDVVSAPLWTTPAFYLPRARVQSNKRVVSAFYCLHFNEMDKQRRQTVCTIADELGAAMKLYGADYPERYGETKTIDAKELVDVLTPVHSMPVILEEEHWKYGALTSRISEAICANVWPYIINQESDTKPFAYAFLPSGTAFEYLHWTDYMHDFTLPFKFHQYLATAQQDFVTILNHLADEIHNS